MRWTRSPSTERLLHRRDPGSSWGRERLTESMRIAIVVPVALVWACATNPATSRPRTGEALGVHTSSERIAIRQDVKVAEIEYVDRNGRTVGKESVRKTRYVGATMIHWRPM